MLSKHLAPLLLLIFLLSLSACAGAIKIERIPTPTLPPTPTAPRPTPTTAAPLQPEDNPRRIVVEKIDLDAPVVEMGWMVQGEGSETVSLWEVPENEAGWHLNSAQPGQGGNVVISGHNNSSGGHVFGALEALEIGDQVTLLTADDTPHTYRIDETQIVRTLGASQETLDYLRAVIQPTPDERLTLITCWPSWTNTHRLIIIATPL